MTVWEELYGIGQNMYRAGENVLSVINEVDIKSRDALDYNIDDSTLGQSEYDFRYRVFPADLANDYVGHYMIININVPVFENISAYRNQNQGIEANNMNGAKFLGGLIADNQW